MNTNLPGGEAATTPARLSTERAFVASLGDVTDAEASSAIDKRMRAVCLQHLKDGTGPKPTDGDS